MPKHIEGLSAKAWPAPSHTRGKHAGASQPTTRTLVHALATQAHNIANTRGWFFTKHAA